MKLIMMVSYLIVMLLGCFSFVPNIIADFELGDPFLESENVTEGIYRGNVTNGVGDIFTIEVPAEKEIVIDVRKLDNDEEEILVKGYDNDMNEMIPYEIDFTLFGPNDIEMGRWYNSDNQSKKIYISITGNGSYEMTVQILENSKQSVVESTYIVLLSIPLLIILLLIIVSILIAGVIIIYIKKKKVIK